MDILINMILVKTASLYMQLYIKLRILETKTSCTQVYICISYLCDSQRPIKAAYIQGFLYIADAILGFAV